MKAYLDEQFGRMAERVDENSRQIEDLKEEARQTKQETRQQIEDLKEDTRHTRVLVEGIRSDVRLIAEGVMGGIEQQEAHRKEIQAAVDEIKTSVVLSYRSQEGRVQSLEDQAERQRHDVFEALRKRFGSSRTGQETPSSLFDDPLSPISVRKSVRRPPRRRVSWTKFPNKAVSEPGREPSDATADTTRFLRHWAGGRSSWCPTVLGSPLNERPPGH